MIPDEDRREWMVAALLAPVYDFERYHPGILDDSRPREMAEKRRNEGRQGVDTAPR